MSTFVPKLYERYTRIDFSMERMANGPKVEVETKNLVTKVSRSVLVWRKSAKLFTRYAISKIRDQLFWVERAGIASINLLLCAAARPERPFVVLLGGAPANQTARQTRNKIRTAWATPSDPRQPKETRAELTRYCWMRRCSFSTSDTDLDTPYLTLQRIVSFIHFTKHNSAAEVYMHIA